MNFAKFLRTPFLENTSEHQLPLYGIEAHATDVGVRLYVCPRLLNPALLYGNLMNTPISNNLQYKNTEDK